jgi:pre-mRNA-processing factor 40
MDHPVTLEEERKVWTIHKSVNGTTYYYNRATKKSQYEMPECSKTTEEVLEHPDWKEYRTAEGKKFYYNAMTRKSEWQLPNEVKEYRIKL